MNKFWKWYDNLNEPKRFFFAIFVLCSPVHISSIMGSHDPRYYLLMGLMIPIMATRIFYQIKSDILDNIQRSKDQLRDEKIKKLGV